MSKANEQSIDRAEQTLTDLMLVPHQFTPETQKEIERDLQSGGAGLFKR